MYIIDSSLILSYVTITDLFHIMLTKHSLIPCPVLVPFGCQWEQNQTNQSNHTCQHKVDKSTVSHWRVLYHFSTGPRLLQGQGNDDNGIEELKETSDGKEDSNKKTFHRLRTLSWDELQGCGNNKKGTNSKKETW